MRRKVLHSLKTVNCRPISNTKATLTNIGILLARSVSCQYLDEINCTYSYIYDRGGSSFSLVCLDLCCGWRKEEERRKQKHSVVYISWIGGGLDLLQIPVIDLIRHCIFLRIPEGSTVWTFLPETLPKYDIGWTNPRNFSLKIIRI